MQKTSPLIIALSLPHRPDGLDNNGLTYLENQMQSNELIASNPLAPILQANY